MTSRQSRDHNHLLFSQSRVLCQGQSLSFVKVVGRSYWPDSTKATDSFRRARDVLSRAVWCAIIWLSRVVRWQGAEVIVKDRRHLTAVHGKDAALQLSSDASVSLRYAALVDYPELVPVLLSARAAVVEAFDIDESMQADLVHALERVAVEAMVAAYAPMVVAATELKRVNEGSRSAQAVRVAGVAEVMAVRVGEIAAQLHRRDEDSALRVATEASVAADGVAASTTPGIGVAKAAEVAAAVHAAAESRAAEQASAAMVVAEMAASAALKVASEADAAAATVERKAFDAASSVQGIGLNMCYEIAIDAAASAAHRALARPLR